VVAKLNEEKELKLIRDEFKEAIETFSKKEYEKARELFHKIVGQYQNSEYYSVLEVQARSKVYESIADAQLNPLKIELDSEEDYLNEGLYCLNSGDYDRALELFGHLENKKYSDPHLWYLMSIAYFKTGDKETSLNYLKKCIRKDEYYKIVAHNEPDFESLLEDGKFLSLLS
jgi:tetratricopeptide (TPR) repeat protein